LHANRGWLLLGESKVEEALGSFRAALRLDPGMEWARLGIIEAMKAQNSVYRLFLRCSMWKSSLGTLKLAILVFALAAVSNFALGTYRQHRSLWPLLVPIGAVCGLFIFGPWISDPLSNLFLRANSAGRLALNRAESIAANLVAVCLALAAVAAVTFTATRSMVWLVLGAVALLMLVPIGGAAKAHGTRAWTSCDRAVAVGGGVLAAVAVVAPRVITSEPVDPAAIVWGASPTTPSPNTGERSFRADTSSCTKRLTLFQITSAFGHHAVLLDSSHLFKQRRTSMAALHRSAAAGGFSILLAVTASGCAAHHSVQWDRPLVTPLFHLPARCSSWNRSSTAPRRPGMSDVTSWRSKRGPGRISRLFRAVSASRDSRESIAGLHAGASGLPTRNR
jgi:hypothetical protein